MTRRTHASHEVALFTGFPGLIGAKLLPRLLELSPGSTFKCVVQEKFLGLAKRQLEQIEATHAHTRGRIGLVLGDITHERLGIDAAEAKVLQRQITSAYHLAAVYDLAVKRDLGMKVNVEGTRRVLEFLAECKTFERLHYVSTAYVSGTAVGVYRETDLDVGQSFKNYYEETKFLAEVEVVRVGLPYSVYRPGIVVGDSRTGETGKFDGPYFALRAMTRLPSPGMFMKVGSGKRTINLVPIDFVIEALAQLAQAREAEGRTYHLTDPEPPTVFEVEELFARALGKSFVYVPVPLAMAKLSLAPGPVQKLLGLPAQTVDYFDHPVEYDCSLARRDLSKAGVVCPKFHSYVQRLVAYYLEKQGSVRRDAMV